MLAAINPSGGVAQIFSPIGWAILLTGQRRYYTCQVSKPPSSPLVQLTLPLYAPSLTWGIGLGTLNAVMVITALELGMHASLASALVGIAGITAVITGPLIGRFVDRLGDRNALITGSVLATFALVATLISLRFSGHRFAQLIYLGAIVALALSSGIWQLGRQCYVTETVPVAFRARAMSMLGGIARLGRLVGPAIGSATIAAWGVAGAFYLQIVTALLAAALVAIFTAPDPQMLAAGATGMKTAAPKSVETPSASSIPPQAAERSSSDALATALLAVCAILLSLVRAGQIVVVPLVGRALAVSNEVISATFAVSALLDVTVFYASGQLMDRFGRRAAIIPSLTIMGVGFIALGMAGSLVPYFISACTVGLGNGLAAGILFTMGADLSPEVGRSRFLGIWQSISQIGPTVGPFLTSAIVGLASAATAAEITGILAFTGCLWSFFAIPRAYRRIGMDERARPL